MVVCLNDNNNSESVRHEYLLLLLLVLVSVIGGREFGVGIRRLSFRLGLPRLRVGSMGVTRYSVI